MQVPILPLTSMQLTVPIMLGFHTFKTYILPPLHTLLPPTLDLTGYNIAPYVHDDIT